MKSNLLGLFVLSALLLTACGENPENRNYPESPKRDEKIDNPTSESNWQLMSPEKNKTEGVRSLEANKAFGLKHEKEIIVAVIDGGVDIHHEDLAGKIWTNPRESGLDDNGRNKATNGVDDDKNGYVDDVYGWNFIGGKNGENIVFETLELTRELVRFEKIISDGKKLSPEENQAYEKIKKTYDDELGLAEQQSKKMNPIDQKIVEAKKILQEKLGIKDWSKPTLEKIKSSEKSVVSARDDLLKVIADYRSIDRFYRILTNVQNTLQYYLNKTYYPRSIVGDDPDDFSQTQYGNNDVVGPDADHGTHVAGIIGAVNGNGIGIDGIAKNVKIMVLRVVPNGDERDKDVAMAVRYATDNGAQIINMSFGKQFSPHKKQVDEAFIYAAQNGVLLVHAAGNDGKNNDLAYSFPNRIVQNATELGVPNEITTWLEVGASSSKKGLDLAAAFSNYGKVQVDIFAPGVAINSCIPGNKYAAYSGTSMAAPTASGVAALLISNFAEMNPEQARNIMLHTSRLYKDLKVRRPGSGKFDLPVFFEELSHTGGITDAYTAVKFAKELAGP